QGYITQNEYNSAINEPIITADKTNTLLNGTLTAKACEFYISQAQKEVCEALGLTKTQLNNSGMKIYTNLDVTLQAELEKQRLSADNFESDNIGSVSIVLDNATGAVLAYSSTYPYAISRQAGSVLKPLAVYAPAIDKGLISLATPIIDEQVNFGGYSPNNYGGIYYGDTTVREAIKKSMNSVSVKVLDYLGIDASAAYLAKLGIDISDADKSYALALGATSSGVSPLTIACGYMSLARGGNYVKPSFVKYIWKNGRKTILGRTDDISGLRTGEPETKDIFLKSTAELLTSALADTVKDGTAKTLGSLPFTVASKTGTAERSRGGNSDAWNASYNSQYTVLVWHGSDDGMSEKGGGYPTRHALKIWRALDNSNHIYRSFLPFENVISQEIDVYSTKQSRKVVASTQNTPLEYRKTELFALDNLPDYDGSKFDIMSPTSMTVENLSGKIRIAFDSEKVYVYELYRKDITGTKCLYSGIGTGDEISITDRPITFDGKVDYTLICSLKNNEEVSATT
ncbi:MAG: hypothetical protein K2M36_03895, partial [Clostridia bacterium]|nr:hypothetical protein [Clostridia bacterium]